MQDIAVVDIREEHSSVAVLSLGLKGSELKGASLVKGVFTDPATASRVREEVRRFSPDPDFLILLPPRGLFHLTSLEVPAKNEEMLYKMMEFEIPRHFPIPREQLLADYTIASKTGEAFTVNLAGMRRQDFDAYFDAARQAGLYPDSVSVPGSVLFPETGAGRRTAVTLWPEGFDLSFADGKRTAYSRFTRFKPRLEERDYLEGAFLADGPAPAIAEQVMAEIGRARLVSGMENLESYFAQTSVCGGAPRLRGAVAQRLGRKDEFRIVDLRALPPAESLEGPEFLPRAWADARLYEEGRAFNFIPKKLRRLRHTVLKRMLWGSLAAIAALFLLWMGGAYYVRWNTLSGLKADLAALKKEAAKGEGAQLKLEEYQSYFDGYNAFARRKAFTLAMFESAAKGFPKTSFLTELDFRDCKLAFSGIAADASGLIKEMEGTGVFRNAQMLGAVQNTGAGERFKLGVECK